MPQWMVDLFGASLAPIVWVALVAAMVCLLAIVVILLAKRLLANGTALGPRMRVQRLQVVDVARVDDKRKLVLVRRDDVEHLVLVGGQTDILVEASISRSPAPPREVRSEDGRLDIPAISPGSSSPGRREPAAPPLTATRQDETAPPSGTAAGGGKRPPAMRWPEPAAPAEPPSPPVGVSHHPAPAGRSGAEAVTSADRRGPDTFPASVPAGDAGGRDSEATAKMGGSRPKPIDQRQTAFVPAVETPLKPTEPPALNPSTMAFSRATPTIRSKADVEPVEPVEPHAKPQPAMMPPQAEIRPGSAPKPPEAVAPASRPMPPQRENGNGAQPPLGDRRADPGSLPTGLTARSDVSSDAPSDRKPAGPASPDSGKESRPLSVRSFASAIQSRRYSRPETSGRAPLGTSSKPPMTTGTTDSQSGAASRDAARQATGQSIEEFLSADLSEELTRDLEAAIAEPAAAPAAPARPAAESAIGTASSSHIAIEAATSSGKPAALAEASSKEGMAGEPKPDKPAAWQASRSQSANEPVQGETRAAAVSSFEAQSPEDATTSEANDPPPASPSTTATTLAQSKPAASPAPSLAKTAAPARPGPAVAGPALSDAAPPTDTRKAAAEPTPPAAVTARPARQARPALEIDLEEEMKRLLGELDIEGPSEQRKA